MMALIFASCSKEEVVSIPQDGITYNVVSGKQTRALDSYCNNTLPDYFMVWAQNVENNSVYINGDKIENKGGNPVIWADADGTRYWPKDKKLDFYAHVNGEGFFSYNNGAPTFDQFTVKDNVAEQVDLMYAVMKGLSEDVGTVNVNFRHALSQVAFKAINNNPNLHVEISGVSIGHIGNTATFTYPTASTDENFVDHTDNPSDQNLTGQGEWGEVSGDKVYSVAFDSPIKVGSTVTNLTCPGDDHVNGFKNVMTLMPQQVAAWNPEIPGDTWNGAYFLVDLKICNISGEAYVETDEVLYQGEAAIPVEIDWVQGKRYIYTLIFNNGGDGGYTPDPTNPNPVLPATIKYNTTVDDFIPANGGDHNMDSGKEPEVVTTTYTLVYNGNGDDVTGVPQTATYTGTADSHTFTISSTEPKREGMIFKGWSEATDGAALTETTIKLYKSSPSKTLYALWEVAPVEYTYTLNFDAGDGATGAPQQMTITTTEKTHLFTLPKTVPVKGGYVFKGWSLVEPAKQDMNTQLVIGTIELNANESNVTLHAVWAVKQTGGSNPDPDVDNPYA